MCKKITKPKQFLILSFGFTLFALRFTFNCYALNIDKVQGYFLAGDYKSAIQEGERILANPAQPQDLDKLYYILGLSYLKDGNTLRASDIFEIILSEFKDSNFREEAMLGLGDTCLFRGDYAKAKEYYKELLGRNTAAKLQPAVYYRLSQIAAKSGDTQEAKEYIGKLRQDFYYSPESRLSQDIGMSSDSPSDFYYTVQVGSFTNKTNAKILTEKLIQKGYSAFIEESSSREAERIYRVRVGKFNRQEQAKDLKDKLSQEGYPTKIYP